MSNSYQSNIQKHSTILQKIIEESGKSENPNIINMSTDFFTLIFFKSFTIVQ
jgi:hypothetical protein